MGIWRLREKNEFPQDNPTGCREAMFCAFVLVNFLQYSGTERCMETSRRGFRVEASAFLSALQSDEASGAKGEGMPHIFCP